MYYLVRTMWLYLASKFGHRYFIVYEWVCKTEYQGRGAPHWHIACWVICFGILDQLKGRTGTAIVSAFVKFLELVFQSRNRRPSRERPPELHQRVCIQGPRCR